LVRCWCIWMGTFLQQTLGELFLLDLPTWFVTNGIIHITGSPDLDTRGRYSMTDGRCYM